MVRPNKGIANRVNSTIWSEVIEISKRDLRANLETGRSRGARINQELTLKAAKYFFVQPVNSDEQDIKTFTGLMVASGINPDMAAKKIFDDLTQVDQRRVCLLLRNAGYKVHPTYLRTDKFID